MKRKDKRRRRKRLLTMLLCGALCASNIMPTNVYVYAEECIESEVNVEEHEEELIADNPGSVLDEDETIGNSENDSDENENTENPGNESDEDKEEENPEGDLDEDENVGNPENDLDEDGRVENSGENSDDGEIIDDGDRSDVNDADDTNQGEESNAEDIDQPEETADALVMAEINNIASGSYTEDGSNLTWVIDSSGKLTVSGTGEFAPISTKAPSYYDRVVPWYEYRSNITSADIRVIGMTDASFMLHGLYKLTNVDLSSFDASTVTNMARMFDGCQNLTSLDLSGLDTGSVTNMNGMFLSCYGLKSINLRGKFNTAQVTDFSLMFDGCWELETLDLSNFNTEKAITMEYMFSRCQSLKKLDLQNFDTSNVGGIVDNVMVNALDGMFSNCENLTEINLSSFRTPKMTHLGNMFYNCKSLTEVDISNFDTGNTQYITSLFWGCTSLQKVNLSGWDTSSARTISFLFYNCSSLTEVDLSSFDLSSATMTAGMFIGCTNLSKIKTPYNYNADEAEPAVLPKAQDSDVWYQPDGTEITTLPRNLSYSITITRNEIPEGSHIEASKTKIEYECGDVIAIDDLTVTWYDKNGAPTKLDSNRYTTNVGQLDTKTPGKRMLTITYVDDSGVTYGTTIELMVTLTLNQSNTNIELAEEERIYNKNAWVPTPTVNITIDGSSKPLDAGTDYTVDYSDNVNAGTEAKVIIRGINDYKGEVTRSFTIGKAEAHLTANDMILAINDELPQTQDYSYEVTGLMNGDALVSEPTFKCDVQDTSYVGTYTIIPENADAGNNYTIIYHNGILKVAEERIICTVKFDLMGHEKNSGVDIDVQEITDVKVGSMIDEPIALQEGTVIKETQEGRGETAYVFTGWYKDKTFAVKQKWNFDTDTVQADTTLYACWLEKGSAGDTGLQFSIQDIQDQYYTGSAIKPTVYVYTADGRTLLKSGKDYTIKYVNNTEADTEEERTQGGIGHTIDDATNGFNPNIAYVIITGKGNYSETIYKNFHILPAKISTEDGDVAAGFTLKYSDQLVTNTKKDRNPFSSLKYKKAMKLGTDYAITLTAYADVKCDESITYEGDLSKWSANTMKTGEGKAAKYSAPTIPKGFSGIFTMRVEGVGNYEGSFEKTVMVTDKDHLMKNASISLGKNIKTWSYDETNGRAVILTPGYMVTTDSKIKEYYAIRNGQSEKEDNADHIFLVSAKDGKTIRYLRVDENDFFVSYTNNKAVGTATMTITGNPEKGYYGSKSVTFKITGTAFSTKNIDIIAYDAETNPNMNDWRASIDYTGRAITQNKITLTTKDKKTLTYGTHYTISYKNNIKKGTATMTFTAKPESGYTGSFKKTFKITPVDISKHDNIELVAVKDGGHEQDSIDGIDKKTGENGTAAYTLKGTVTYTREGVKPSAHIRISLAGQKEIVLKEGTDYTVSYANNTVVKPISAEKLPTMTIKGKGNYSGSLKVTYTIGSAAMENNDNITVSVAAVAFDSKKTDGDYPYTPKITVKDGKKTLQAGKDYNVKWENNSQSTIKEYLNKLADLAETEDAEDGKTWNEIKAMRPYAVITAPSGSDYTTTEGKGIEVDLNIYGTKLASSNLYAVISKETYTGEQIIPKEVTVYVGEPAAVKQAKKDVVTGEEILTKKDGTYNLTKLTLKTEPGGDGDYTLTYGANNTAGKNKGSVTINGAGMYGGSVTVKFEIQKRNVYDPLR